MTTTAEMSPRTKARIAGLFYFLLVPIGAIQVLAGRVPASSDPAIMAANILTHRSAVYCSFATDLLVIASYIPVTALLYELFKSVSRSAALTFALFDLAGCSIQAVAVVFRIAPLTILTSGVAQQQVQLPAFILLKLYSQTYRVALVFFAFHMLVLGGVIFRSTFMPRWIGILVMIAGAGWTTFLWPPLAGILWPRVLLPLDVGEAALILWLLIKGVDVERWNARAREVRE
jgi:hypothetical protein